MPPNRKKLPKDFSNLAALQATTTQSCSGADEATTTTFPPLTTQEDIVAASNDSGDEYYYFQEDIEKYEHPVLNSTHEEEEDRESRAKVTRRYIKRLSSLVRQPKELNIDQKRLQQATDDIGTCAYGLQAISVWLFDDENHRLCPSDGGWWYNPVLVDQSEALERLIDSSREDHVPLSPVSPGVDIAGLLWLESNKFECVTSKMMNRVHSINQLVGVASHGSLSALRHDQPEKNESLIWRDLRSLVEDPDTAKGPRMALLHEAGIEQATGIPFQTELHSGMVIFFAEKDVDQEVLNGHANVAYL
jgi:hypothetical protein